MIWFFIMMEDFPELGSKLVIFLGWFLVILGVAKMLFWLIGELWPSAWSKIKSPAFQKILTGMGNRLLFGLGGLITVLLGLGSVGAGYLIRKLHGLE